MKKAALLAVGALLFGLAGPAFAGGLAAGAPTFSIAVSSSEDGDRLPLTPDLQQILNGTFSGTASGSTPSFSFSSDLNVGPDPFIMGSFTLENLSGKTQIFTVSATLGTSPLPAPTYISGFFGTVEFTDTNGDASVTFASPTLASPGTVPFMTAQIDGSQVAVLGAFNEHAEGGAGISGTHGIEIFGVQTGPGVTGSIGTAFAFSITPGDTVHVPFGFTVAPEPEGLATFAIVFALFLCTFAPKSASRLN